jgi:serine/threonine protein kinase
MRGSWEAPFCPCVQEKVLLTCTEKVDSWAVGILTYELLVGRPPFEKESRDETYQLIMHEDPAFPSWMSEGARDFISIALAKVGGRRRQGTVPWAGGSVLAVAGGEQ